MSTKFTDALVFIPLIPVLPVMLTWYLPWERWIPRRVPNSVIGPYLLYSAFAAWYFKMPPWFVAGISLWGIIVCAMAFFKEKAQA